MVFIASLFLGYGLISTILVSVKLVNPTADAGHFIPLDAPYRLAIYLSCLAIGITFAVLDYKSKKKKGEPF